MSPQIARKPVGTGDCHAQRDALLDIAGAMATQLESLATAARESGSHALADELTLLLDLYDQVACTIGSDEEDA